ncbi:metallophosphoesterase [Marinospirillum sp.]|uniref:metallophosphoesterase n=1 Tax=Marinospirillum sp. TaxID=2183934 RepID=UPI0025C2FD5D|nr:metallophosphoesterase [Marinospirillum sp.]
MESKAIPFNPQSIHVVSDIHLEFYPLKSLTEREEVPVWSHLFPAPDPQALLILAGDIVIWRYGSGLKATSPVMNVLKWLSPRFGAVVYVPGNHEFYRGVTGGYYEQKLLGLLTDAGLTNVYLLQNSEAVFGGSLRVLGSTFWTDMDKGSPLFETRIARLQGAPSAYNDLNYIRHTDDQKKHFPRLRVSHVRSMHQQARSFLQEALEKPFAGQTWVITHHLPSPRLIAPEWQADWRSPAYASHAPCVST